MQATAVVFRRKSSNLVLVSGIVCCLVFLNACGSGKTGCKNFAPATDEAKYCNNHREAVIKFVKDGTDGELHRGRLKQFKDFYKTLKGCRNVRCLEEVIYADEGMWVFSQRYTLEHEFARQQTRINRPRLEAELILTGFRHAIEVLEAEFEGKPAP